MNGNSTFFSEGQDGLCSPPVHGVGQAQLLQDHWQRIPDHGRILEKSKEQTNKQKTKKRPHKTNYSQFIKNPGIFFDHKVKP